MNHVRDEVDVALPATPTGVRTERLLHGEAQEEQFDVMDVELVRGLPLACTFLEVSVVPCQAGGKSRFRDMGPPDWKEPIALSVGILKGGTFPLFPASSQPGLGGEQGQVTAGINLASRYLGKWG